MEDEAVAEEGISEVEAVPAAVLDWTISVAVLEGSSVVGTSVVG